MNLTVLKDSGKYTNHANGGDFYESQNKQLLNVNICKGYPCEFSVRQEINCDES
jgi:hypothetical protein